MVLRHAGARGTTVGARFLLLGIAVAACDGGPELLAPQACQGDSVVVHVVLDSHVEFAWSPACPVAWLDVILVDSGTSRWVVTGGDAGNVIHPVVRYGVVPSEAVVLREAEPLQQGHHYRVNVFRWIGEPGGPGSIFLAGHTTFAR